MRSIRDDKLARMAARLLSDLTLYSRFVVGRPLRGYQVEAGRAVLASVLGGRGDAISVVMARQAGKNELSAHLEAYLLSLHAGAGGAIVKTAPTGRTLLEASRLRLEWALENPLDSGSWRREENGLRLGRARARFLPAEAGAGAAGATASLLLEVDEAQGFEADLYERDFAPMAASSGATRVFYGTAWRDDDLLQRVKAESLALQRRDGRRRHFEFAWDVVAEHNPDYARYALGERARLGEDHPLFRTQYRLQALGGEADLLGARQRELMRGRHRRLRRPEDDGVYVAGVDPAGPGEEDADGSARRLDPCERSTVVTIARVGPVEVADGVVEPRLEVVEHRRWSGRGHPEQWQGLLETLRDVWRCRRVVVGAPGRGPGAADFLRGAMGDVVRPLTFTAEARSRLGCTFLAAVNGGRFRMYGDPAVQGDEDGGAAEFWRQASLARYAVRRDRQLDFFVPPAQGRDDFVVSAALCAWAARDWVVPTAGGLPQRQPGFDDGLF